MKVRYSLEAFALAMVLFTAGVEAALIVAAVIVAGTILGDMLASKAGKTAACVVAGLATYAALIGSLIYTGLVTLDKVSVEYIGAVLVAILVAKHVADGVEEASNGEILKQNYAALIVMVVVAAVREILGSGALFGYEIGKFAVISGAYKKICFGLIFGGLGVAALNAIVKKETAADSLWVAVSVAIVMVAGAVIGKADAVTLTKTVVSAVIGVVLLVSVRGKLVFSAPGKSFAGLPVELISYGFLTMMLSIIA